jgi:hypothetical protein
VSKRKQEPVSDFTEPKIAYNRTLSLVAPNGGVKLSHLRELMREAADRGFVPDAKVTIRSSTSFMSDYQLIDISDKA